MSSDDGAPSSSIRTLAPVWQVNSRVSAFCTARLGGVSLPPYDGLNLGLHVGDDAGHVVENRRRLQEFSALPGNPYWLNQTHSTHVVRVDARAQESAQGYAHGSGQRADNTQGAPQTSGQQADSLGYTVPEADGAWTNQPDTVLAVLTADCLPVVISDSTGAAVAVVHAGWRGLAAGILENALALFDGRSNLHAWLGPAIGPDAFEVGEDVRQAFEERNSSHGAAFKQGHVPGKYWCDLYALARSELQQSCSIVVTGGDYCTHRQSQWFHSHRRDGVRSGRMATVVWVSAKR